MKDRKEGIENKREKKKEKKKKEGDKCLIEKRRGEGRKR